MGVVSAAVGLVPRGEEKGKEAPGRSRKAKPQPRYRNIPTWWGAADTTKPLEPWAQGLRAPAYTMGCNAATPTPGTASMQARSASA